MIGATIMIALIFCKNGITKRTNPFHQVALRTEATKRFGGDARTVTNGKPLSKAEPTTMDAPTAPRLTKKVLAGQNDRVTWCKEKGMTLLLSEWDYEANGNLKPEMFTAGSHARIHWVRSEGHRWTAVIKERTKKNGNTCPFCKKKTVK